MNFVLIGMAGAGKSSVGRALAKRLSIPFFDTDEELAKSLGCDLQRFMEQQGVTIFRAREEAFLREWPFGSSAVIATGGSAVLYPAAMAHLQTRARLIYLSAEWETIEQRVTNWQNRAFVAEKGMSAQEVFTFRRGLYERYADVTVIVDQLSIAETVESVMSAILKLPR